MCGADLFAGAGSVPSRYSHLREAIAILAAPADVQDRTPCAEGFPTDYGNDELALMFDDIYPTVRDELNAEQSTAAQRLDDLLALYSGPRNRAFWAREALWHDKRWEAVRSCAREALSAFPPAAAAYP